MDNENKKFDIIDNSGVKHEVSSDDFKLVQVDKSIHDTKFETKPTTFFKDSLKRFSKNKASVTGFVIIGILILLAIIVPLADTSDVSVNHQYETFLAPKIFESGTGWLDGTVEFHNISYDVTNETPDPKNFVKRAVRKITVNPNPEYINDVSDYGVGGYVRFDNPRLVQNEFNSIAVSEHYLRTFAVPTVDFTSSLSMTYTLASEYSLTDYKLTPYRVVARYSAYDSSMNLVDKEVVLKDYSSDYGEVSLDVMALIKQSDTTTTKASKFSVEFAIKDSFDYGTQILIESTKLVSNDTTIVDTTNNLTAKDYFDGLSFTDANEFVNRALNTESSSVKNIKYWSCDGYKHIYNVRLYKCSFVYDTYEVRYGNVSNFVIGQKLMNSYREKGWCTYTWTKGVTSFQVLDPVHCPIVSVDEQTRNGSSYSLSCTISQYKYLGYTEMPKFIFGTDKNGKDYFKLLFQGVRTSLLLGICVSAICFCFGLLWGAISGYFGGIVDLAMERFTEILGGVPWIVMMTLIIVLLGASNFATFALALCLTGWMGTAATTRTQFYRFKNREYVLASRTLGASDLRLIFRHVLPNAMGTIITGAVLMIPSTIFSEATISYLGLGLTGDGSLGVLLSGSQIYINSYGYLLFIPSIVIALLMISFNLFGNGLRDAVNPSLKGSD